MPTSLIMKDVQRGGRFKSGRSRSIQLLSTINRQLNPINSNNSNNSDNDTRQQYYRLTDGRSTDSLSSPDYADDRPLEEHDRLHSSIATSSSPPMMSANNKRLSSPCQSSSANSSPHLHSYQRLTFENRLHNNNIINNNNNITAHNNASFFSRAMDLSGSSQSVNIINDVNVDHLSYEASISVILLCCKKRILYPYLRLISILGWRPLFFSAVEPHCIIRALNFSYPIIITLIILAGHFLEYAACHSDILTGDERLKFAHLTPSLFHLSAYLTVLYFLRKPESERLETLMERVFLQSSRNAGWLICHRKLVRKLRNFFWLCILWVLVAIIMRLFHYFWYEMVYQHVWMCNYQWPFSPGHKAFIVIRIACSAWNDLVCAAIVTTYSVHCELNISYIDNLCSLMRERRITIQEFFKRVEESRNFIEYLNNDQAVGVSLLLLNLICRATVSTIALLHPPNDALLTMRSCFVLLITLVLWFILIFTHVRQALRLTNACQVLKNIGHELRSMHMPSTINNHTATNCSTLMLLDNDRNDLDSLLLYTSSLKMEARILQIPVTSSLISALMVWFTFCILMLAQFGVVNF